MASDDVELLSPMAREACAKRLQAEIDQTWTRFGSHPVIGRVTGTSLRVRKRTPYRRNSFRPYLSAELVEQDGQTRIRCRFAMHPFIRVFVAVWFGGVLLIGGTIFVVSMVALLSDRAMVSPFAWLGLVIPIAMLALGVGLIRFGRYLARDERQFLLEFVRRTVGAKAE